jgi:hypothetical protein
MQHLANFLVIEAQKNDHSFDANELDRVIIENYNPVYSGQHLYSTYYFQ